eukprot:gene9744-9902_t
MSATVSSFCGSSSKAFKANAGLSRRQPVTRGAMAMTMRKKDIHPEWYSEAKGNSSMLVVDEGQLNKFKKRFAGLEEFAEVGAAASIAGAPTEDENGKKIGTKSQAGKKKKR